MEKEVEKKSKVKLWVKICRFIAKYLIIYPFFIIPTRTKIYGKENIPKEGPLIITPNHIHSFDPIILIGVFDKNISFFSKKEIFNHWIGRCGQDIFDMIPVDREGVDKHAIKKGISVLKNKDFLGIFPEGTRDGILKGVDFKDGAVFMSTLTNSKILPIGISYKPKIFGKTIFRIGKPIDLQLLAEENNLNLKNKEDLIKINQILRDKVIDLLEEDFKLKYINKIKENMEKNNE